MHVEITRTLEEGEEGERKGERKERERKKERKEGKGERREGVQSVDEGRGRRRSQHERFQSCTCTIPTCHILSNSFSGALCFRACTIFIRSLQSVSIRYWVPLNVTHLSCLPILSGSVVLAP